MGYGHLATILYLYACTSIATIVMMLLLLLQIAPCFRYAKPGEAIRPMFQNQGVWDSA